MTTESTGPACAVGMPNIVIVLSSAVPARPSGPTSARLNGTVKAENPNNNRMEPSTGNLVFGHNTPGVFPFDDNASWARNAAVLRHLAELAARVRKLEDKRKKNG